MWQCPLHFPAADLAHPHYSSDPRFPQKPQFGTTASLVHSVQGPRAPARQMVVRITLCPCLEGREDPENQPNFDSQSILECHLVTGLRQLTMAWAQKKKSVQLRGQITDRWDKLLSPTRLSSAVQRSWNIDSLQLRSAGGMSLSGVGGAGLSMYFALGQCWALSNVLD